MTLVKPKTIKMLKSGEITVKDFAEELAKSHSSYAIAEAYAELLTSTEVSLPTAKIPITDEMLKEHFRIIGESPRGRKRKDSAE